MKNNNSLTNKEYWHRNFGRSEFFHFNNNSYKKYLLKYLDVNPNKTCIEIGAYPGGNLGYLAKIFHYKPTALDFVDNIDFIKSNMEYNGIKECEIIKEDFLKWIPNKKYDVVCSHGFIEHFLNYEDVLQKHIEILNDDGILIITVPYCEYFQLWIRKMLYTENRYETIKKSHNREIMNIDKLKDIILKKNKLKQLFAGFIGEMNISFPANEATIQMHKLKYYNFIKKIAFIMNRLNISNRFISPKILIIAKKCLIKVSV